MRRFIALGLALVALAIVVIAMPLLVVGVVGDTAKAIAGHLATIGQRIVNTAKSYAA